MYKIAIDVSTNVCAVAVSKNNILLGNVTTYGNLTHTEQLWKNLDTLISISNIEKKNIKEIIIGSGPGSFTGLRIGAAAVKSLAYSFNAKLYSISTLDILASQIKTDNKIIISLIDAKKKELYFSVYTNKHNGVLKRRCSYLLDSPENMIGYIKKPAILIGSGALQYKKYFLDNCVEKIIIPDEKSLHFVNANMIIELHNHGLTELCDIDRFEPMYIRKPDIIKKI